MATNIRRGPSGPPSNLPTWSAQSVLDCVPRQYRNAIETGTFTGDTSEWFAACVERVIARGGGVVYAPRGVWPIVEGWAPALAATPVPLAFLGDGMGRTVLQWQGYAASAIATTNEARGTFPYLSFSGFTIDGSFGLNGNYAASSEFPIYLTGVEDLEILGVEIRNIPYFGIVVRQGNRVVCNENRAWQVSRDAFSLQTCVTVTAGWNQIYHCDDDAITVHTAAQDADSVHQQTTIVGNLLVDTSGIAVGGGRRTAIVGNVVDRPKFRGIRVGAISSAIISSGFSLQVTGNVITDVINRQPIDGLSNGNVGIWLASLEQQGSGVAVPGLPNTGSGVFEPLIGALDNNSVADPLAPTIQANITGNTVARTRPFVAAYSQWGEGLMFTRNGPIDPPIGAPELTDTATAVRLQGGARWVSVCNNVAHGQNICVLVDGTNNDVRAVLVAANVFAQFGLAGVALSTPAGGQCIAIKHNIFDGDPQHSHANRGANGTWTVPGTPYGVLAQTAEGLIVECNHFARVNTVSDAMTAAGDNENVCFGNWLHCNPLGGTGFNAANQGIGTVTPQAENRYIIEDDDPQSATYGRVLNVCKTESNAQPSSGRYVAGAFVRSNLPANGLLGWYRMTTGTNHVGGGVDWTACAF